MYKKIQIIRKSTVDIKRFPKKDVPAIPALAQNNLKVISDTKKLKRMHYV
jgi:hypothetical protein